MDIAMVVVRRVVQTAPYEGVEKITTQQYLTTDLEWSSRADAYQYCSSVAFTEATDNGGEVYLRFANGKEVPVSYEEMFERTPEGELQ
jgi:hypothetical protein